VTRLVMAAESRRTALKRHLDHVRRQANLQSSAGVYRRNSLRHLSPPNGISRAALSPPPATRPLHSPGNSEVAQAAASTPAQPLHLTVPADRSAR
jgi:hypothetical protein